MSEPFADSIWCRTCWEAPEGAPHECTELECVCVEHDEHGCFDLGPCVWGVTDDE